MSDQRQATHTPGPWRTEFNPHAGRFVVSAACQWPDGELASAAICVTPGEGVGPLAAQHEANAHLIAAAPEMLELLKALTGPHGFHPTGSNHRKALELIAKAEGTVIETAPSLRDGTSGGTRSEAQKESV